MADLSGGEATRSTAFGYDAADRQTTVTDALNHQRTRTFDAVGNVVQELDELGRVLATSYTLRGQPATVKLLDFVDTPSTRAPRAT